MKPFVKIALFVVLLIAVTGIFTGLYLFNLKHKDMSKAKPDFVISATLLQQAFENNEKTASAKYINKIIEVRGVVSSVKPVQNNLINISLATGSDLSSVICTFASASDPQNLNQGDVITVRGECSGFLMDVLLNNCALISKQ